jgi:hypothetical protein
LYIFIKQDIDYLFNLSDRTKNESDSAIKLANEVFENATKVLNTLNNFENIINQGKKSLDEAEALKPTIDGNIKSSEELLLQIQQKLQKTKVALNEAKRSSDKSINMLGLANNVLILVKMILFFMLYICYI